MNYIVFDLEWNQSPQKQYEKKAIPFEIIEIGAVKLDENRRIIDSFQALVRPTVYKKMHSITEDIIHLSMKDLMKANGFVKVCSDFIKWCGDDSVFCIWGDLDLTELQRNMEYYKMKPIADGPLIFYDIQKLYSKYYEDGKTKRALSFAVDALKLFDKERTFHRAYDDAYYTALVFANLQGDEILKKHSYDLYKIPIDKKHEVHEHFGNYTKYISRKFENRMELMADKEVLKIKCVYCWRPLRKKIRWFSPNGKHYLCAAHCFKHGCMKGKIRIKKEADDSVYTVKTIRAINEKEFAELKEKKLKAKKSKAKKVLITGEEIENQTINS